MLDLCVFRMLCLERLDNGHTLALEGAAIEGKVRKGSSPGETHRFQSTLKDSY